MFKILIPAVAALGLVAHAAQSYTAEDGVGAAPIMLVAETPVEAAPATPAMDWHFHTEGDTAKLAYGVANSDQLVLMLVCTPGEDKVSTLGSVRAEAETATGQTSYTDPMTGGILHESEIDKRDTALADDVIEPQRAPLAGNYLVRHGMLGATEPGGWRVPAATRKSLRHMSVTT